MLSVVEDFFFIFRRKSLLFEAGVINAGLIQPHYIFIIKITFSKDFPCEPKSRFLNFLIIWGIRPVIYFFKTVFQVFGDIFSYRLEADIDPEIKFNFAFNCTQAYLFLQLFIIQKTLYKFNLLGSKFFQIYTTLFFSKFFFLGGFVFFLSQCILLELRIALL